MNWENVDSSRHESVHYSVMRCAKGKGMIGLREMFPNGKADSLNFVLFSTSGVHGTYSTIEEVQASFEAGHQGDDICTDVTFLIVHPRIVALRYGNAEPQSMDDINFLKTLRASSLEAMSSIGWEAR